MIQLRVAVIFLCSVTLQVILLSRLSGKSLFVHGSFISRAIVVSVVTFSSFLILKCFYRPKIKSASKRAVLITGCDSGFGHGLAKRLESQGFSVFACCLDAKSDRSKELESQTGLMHVLQMDVTNDGEVQACVGKVLDILRQEGKYLWAIVNNAGIGRLGFIEMLPMTAYAEQLNVNTLGAVRVTKAFLPFLRGHGRVINVTSLASRMSYPYFSGYSMSKHATLAFSDCLRREMTPFKIKVVTIEPSRYRTEMLSLTTHREQFERIWDASPDHIRKQYGIDYYKAARECMCKGLEDARAEIHEVLDVIEQAIWTVHPDNHYIPHAATSLKFGILNLLPESLLDNLIAKTMLPKDVNPLSSEPKETSKKTEKPTQNRV